MGEKRRLVDGSRKGTIPLASACSNTASDGQRRDEEGGSPVVDTLKRETHGVCRLRILIEVVVLANIRSQE